MSNTEAVQCTATHSHRAAGHPVWRKLIEFKFDDPETTLTFTRRLARENSWSPALAERVVAEYRRFLFLTQVAGHPVTPSEEVDQAWHLHLVYTRSYWEELCGKVFGQALHHGPTKGGIREGAKFEDWYERTLASYRAWFGDPPTSGPAAHCASARRPAIGAFQRRTSGCCQNVCCDASFSTRRQLSARYSPPVSSPRCQPAE